MLLRQSIQKGIKFFIPLGLLGRGTLLCIGGGPPGGPNIIKHILYVMFCQDIYYYEGFTNAKAEEL